MSETLKSIQNLIETPDREIIVAGGPSSSRLLNEMRDHIVVDLVDLDRRVESVSGTVQNAKAILAKQLETLASKIQSIESKLPATSGRYRVDFFTKDFLDGGNTARVDPEYGQATLPFLSVQEKLVGRDSRGKVWVPRTTVVAYAYKDTTPSETDWIVDENAAFALDDRSETAWWRSRGTSGAVWVRVLVPTSLASDKRSNCIILHPFPVLSFDLVSVEFRDPAGRWSSADLSYLFGWDSGDSQLKSVGNLRIWIPESQVVEIRIKLVTSGEWGFSDIKLQRIEFVPSASLVVDFSSYSPGTIQSVTVLGKDQDSLSYLTTSINGQKVSVALTQMITGTTPVVTGVEARN